MSMFRSRWRSALLGAAVLACLLTVLAGSASASSLLDVSGRSALTIDSDAHWIQQAAWDENKVTTYGVYQYIVYWDAADGSGNVYLKITRRQLSNDALQSITFNTTDGKDSDPLDYHNTTVLGVSPVDGRLHVQWVDHSGPIHYAISSSGCLTQASFSSCTFTWQHQTSATTQEANVTYPEYVNDPDGNLYCGFRSGSGSSGTWVWHGYNNDGTWTNFGNILDGTSGSGSYDVDGAAGLDEGWNPATTRGPYVDSVKFDPSGRLHLVWTWRETVPNTSVNPLLEQHDIYYAYSDDNGIHWKDNGGTQIATNQSDPIVVGDTSTIAVSVSLGWYRINTARMTIDRDNQPHLIFPSSDVNTLDQSASNLRSAHFWRTTSGVWHGQWVEPSGDGRNGDITIGSMLFDRANNAYYIYAKNDIGWVNFNDDDHNPTYNVNLPSDHFTIQDDGTQSSLVVQPTSALTQIDTLERFAVPIGTGSSDNRDVVIRVKNTTNATDGYVYFYTDAHPTWVAGMDRTFTVPNDGAFHTITIPMQGATNWSGTLRQLEMLPSYSATAGSGAFTIDYIRVENDAGTIAKGWDFSRAVSLYSAEMSGDNDWNGTWTITDIAPTEPLSWADASGFGVDENLYSTNEKVDFPVLEQGAPGTEIQKIYQYTIPSDSMAHQWGFGVDTIGWNAPKDVSGFGYSSGTIAGTITGNDSQLQSANNMNVPIGTGSTLSIRMKNSTASGQTIAICWAVDGQQTYSSPSRCVQGISVTADNAYHTYNISTSAWGSWAGHKLTRLRIDPSDGSATSGTFNIDYVRILD